jgi:type IV pilus assembly protein PilQ
VTPQITPEGNVILTSTSTRTAAAPATTAGPAINTKQVKTQVLVENGGTVVIGGIFTQDERNEINKVPLLGDIPFMWATCSRTACAAPTRPSCWSSSPRRS